MLPRVQEMLPITSRPPLLPQVSGATPMYTRPKDPSPHGFTMLSSSKRRCQGAMSTCACMFAPRDTDTECQHRNMLTVRGCLSGRGGRVQSPPSPLSVPMKERVLEEQLQATVTSDCIYGPATRTAAAFTALPRSRYPIR